MVPLENYCCSPNIPSICECSYVLYTPIMPWNLCQSIGLTVESSGFLTSKPITQSLQYRLHYPDIIRICQSIDLTRSARELWSEHWPDRLCTSGNFYQSIGLSPDPILISLKYKRPLLIAVCSSELSQNLRHSIGVYAAPDRCRRG
eukprot:sb/3473881/